MEFCMKNGENYYGMGTSRAHKHKPPFPASLIILKQRIKKNVLTELFLLLNKIIYTRYLF